jgi:hypothetical protein
MCIKQTLVERVHDDRARGWSGGTISWDRDIVPLVDAHDALVAEVEHLRGERAAVVTWLRKRHTDTMECDGRINAVSHTYDHAANAIERGDHRI